MKKNLILSAIVGLMAFFNSCSTDFDIVAPYQEIMVINGLVDGLDSVHYVRVGKAFLGEGNVLTMAAQTDSLYFGDNLTVRMEKIVNRAVVDTFSLTRTTEIPKEPGIFGNPYQVMYKTTHHLDEDATYRIVAINNLTGVRAESTTKIFRDINVTSPNPLLPDSIDLASSPDAAAYVTFNPTPGAEMYDLVIRFHYRELDPNGVSIEKYVDWNFPDLTSDDSEIRYILNKHNFYEAIGKGIQNRPGYTYRIDSLSYGHFPIEYIIIQASEDLVTYYKLQNSNGGLTTDRPTFTTVTNGLGLFTSRLQHRVYLYPRPATLNAIDTSAFTRDLDFRW